MVFGEMISLEERKTALLIQAGLIRKELDNLKRLTGQKLLHDTNRSFTLYAGLTSLAESLERKEK